MTRRLVAAFLGLGAVVLFALVVPLGLSFADAERDELIARVERDANAVAFYVEDELDPTSPDVGIDFQGLADGYRERTGGRLVITDAAGIVLGDGDPVDLTGVGRDLSTRPEVAEALAGSTATGIRTSETLGGRIVFVAVPVSSGGFVHGVVRITYPTAVVDARVRERWLSLGVTSLVAMATAAVIALLLARSVTAPLRRLEDAADDLGGGDLDARAPEDAGPPEVRALARTFNAMAAQLQVLLAAQQQFVADASHELRTPLTALRLRLGAFDHGDATEEAVEAAQAEVERMARLVDGLLALARADRAAGAGDRSPVPLAPFLDERRDAWLPLAEDAGVALEVAPVDGLRALGHPDRLAQVVDNLVANAVDASAAGQTVRLAAESHDGWVELHVVDNGRGLSPEGRARAFDRFWRGPDARAGGLGGNGLGLAIVRTLVEADGGTVRLDDAPGGGVDAVVRLRRA